jgi:hypothetical protein
MLVLAIVVSTVLVGMSIKADLPVTQLTAEQAANIQTKQEFAATHGVNNQRLTRAEIDDRQSKFEDILQDINLTPEQRELEVNRLGYYVFKQEHIEVDNRWTNQDKASRANDPQANNVHITMLRYYFNSNNNYWTISATGELGSPWGTKTLLWPSVGSKHNVGGVDTVGILLHDISGDTRGLELQGGGQSRAWLSDNSGHTVENTYRSASVGSSLQGAVYDIQDYQIVKTSNIFTGYSADYVGRNFGAMVTYNEKFANIDGNAVLFYAHTWDNSRVTSVSFGVGAQELSVGWSWEKDKQGFAVISDRDSRF